MKLQLFVALLVVAGSYALPRTNEVFEPSNVRNSVENRIRMFIERLITRIERANLDPLEVERRDFGINLESVNIVVEAFVENLRFSGASDIRIHTLEYSNLFNRLRLDVSLPELSLTIGDSGLKSIMIGREIEGQLKGSVSIKSIRVAGVAYIHVSIISGISLRRVSLDCSIGGIESDLSVVAQGSDRSELVNNLLSERIPKFLEEKKDVINKALEVILYLIFN